MEANPGRDKRSGGSPDLLITSAYAGIGAGAIGSSIGSGYATLKGHPVLLWTTASGVQWFILGSTFWMSRGLTKAFMESGQRREPLSFGEELACSTIAGSMAGIAGGAVRGRANVIPGAIVCGLLGLSGQIGTSTLATFNESRDRRPLLDRLSDSKWWPMKSIPDADYKQQLQSQIDGIDVEISMVDDRISALRRQRHAASTKG